MIDEILPILSKACGAIMEVYQKEGRYSLKSDSSPVTEADIQASEILVEGLTKVFSLPVNCEEAASPWEERRAWSKFWLVDPLDGTKDFLAKNDEFTVNIALIADHIPLFGVIAVPASGDVYFAQQSKGAFWSNLKNWQPKRIFNDRAGPASVALLSRFHHSSETEEYLRTRGIGDKLPMGAAAKFCALASGKADVYPRFSGSKEWDIAAGHCLLLESGCQIIDLETSKPPLYNKEHISNGPFIAYRNGLLP